MAEGEQGLTIVMPARDEETHLREAAEIVLEVGVRYFKNLELLIVDDGSIDQTGAIAENLAGEDSRVAVVHNRVPLGLSGVVQQGLDLARHEYFMYVDGKGATPADALDTILSNIGKADLVIPYPTNSCERPLARRLISWLYQQILNLFFGLRLKYYNHLVVYRTTMIRSLAIKTDSYGFQAECVIKLLKKGASFVEVGVEDRFDLEGRKTKAFQLRNILGVGRFFFQTFWDIQIKR